MSLFFESRERLQSALETNGLQRLVSLIKPCVRLRTSPTPDLAIPVGASKVGGAPDLPNGFPWPDKGGAPLSFLAQIDLADVSNLEAASPLPKEGLLSFFYDAEECPWGFDPKDRGSWAVAWTSPSEPLVRVKPPLSGFYEEAVVPCRLSPSASVTLPPGDDLDVEELEMSPDEDDAYSELLEGFMASGPAHQMFGDPDQVQNEMRTECQLASNGIYCGNGDWFSDPRTSGLMPGAREWRLLLQLDSDDDAGIMWGDSGMLYFWIRESDLRAHDFSKVWLVLQCC